MTAHTPGPWIARRTIAEAGLPTMRGDILLIMGDERSTPIAQLDADDNEAMANALLIASAPDLYRLLRKAISHFDHDTVDGWLLEAETVIDRLAMAEGGGA